jgi:hypothetical protein
MRGVNPVFVFAGECHRDALEVGKKSTFCKHVFSKLYTEYRPKYIEPEQ